MDTCITIYMEFKPLNIYLCFHHTMTSSHARETIANNQGKILLHILTWETLLVFSFLSLRAITNMIHVALFYYIFLVVSHLCRYLINILLSLFSISNDLYIWSNLKIGNTQHSVGKDYCTQLWSALF